MPINKGIVLASRPASGRQGDARQFRAVRAPRSAEPAPGQVLVRNAYPVARSLYARPHGGIAILCRQPGDRRSRWSAEPWAKSSRRRTRVSPSATRWSAWAAGSFTASMTGRCCARSMRPKIPIQAWLGALGMPGVTAWYGVNRIIAPKRGETLVVSAATGAVGSVVGQLAKAAGARAVGIAGGPEKCAFAVEELGFDACVDHRSANFEADLKAAVPQGIDGLFENVGGKCFAACLRRLNDFSRIALCGTIASYEGKETTALPRFAARAGATDQDPGLHRERPSRRVAAGDRRTGGALRRGQAEMAGDHRGRDRGRAESVPGPAGRREFRQAIGASRLKTCRTDGGD